MIDVLLPRTDAGVAAQAALAVVVLGFTLLRVRHDPDLRRLVVGFSVLTAGWFALRALH